MDCTIFAHACNTLQKSCHGSSYGTTVSPYTRQCLGLPHELAHCIIPGYHSSLSAVTHVPFHAPMLRPASQADPMHEAAGVGK